MKPVKYIGIALVAASALGVVACNNESLSAPDFNSVYSSAAVTPNLESSSSENKQQPVSSGEQNITQSSSSVNALSSSSKMELCKHVTDVVCEPCPPGEKCSCHPCDASIERESYDCKTGKDLHCEDGEWLTPEQFCPNGRWTTNCNGELAHYPVCCTEKETCVQVVGKVCAPCMEGYKCPCNPCEKENAEAIDCSTGDKLICKDGEWNVLIEQKSSSSVTVKSSSSSATTKSSSSIAVLSSSAIATCKHITDVDYATGQSCVNQNGSSAVDCVTGGNYQCKDNRWQKVACLNIKPDECKPGMGGCGYRLCEPNGIKEIPDCENSVVYVCNGEMWNVKETENNKLCAQGQMEYCDACFEEGKFEGRYKCEKGKWRKYGMGDEICEHITDLKCELGKDGCGACEIPKKGEEYEVRDCSTGEVFVCQEGFWVALVTDCDGSASCGFDE